MTQVAENITPETLSFDDATHTYSVNGDKILSVTQILKLAGLIDDEWFTPEAAARGRAVHAAVHYMVTDDLDWSSLHETIVPYLNGYAKFLRETSFKPGLIERRVFNPVYRYAGTLDQTGLLFGEKALIDIKTGPVAPWVALQTAAYDICFPARRRRYALQLKPDGSYTLHPFESYADGDQFLAFLSCVNWKIKNRCGGLS